MRPRSLRVAVTGAIVFASCVVGVASAAPTGQHDGTARKTKKFVFTYQSGQQIHASNVVLSGCTATGQSAGTCFPFDVPTWAKYISVAGTDVTAQPTPISLYPNTGEAPSHGEAFVCGAQTDIVVAPGSSWTVAADALSVDPHCKSLATTGTITIVVSNLR